MSRNVCNPCGNDQEGLIAPGASTNPILCPNLCSRNRIRMLIRTLH